MKIAIIAEPWAKTSNESFLWGLIGRGVKYHMWALLEYFPDDNTEAVIMVDPSNTGLRVMPVNKRIALAEIKKNPLCKVWVRDIEQPVSVKFHWFELLSCVTIIKRMIGVKSRWVVTPKQLMKVLDATS